ncbi:efflux RND transporter permease subunit [Frigoriglobus tundricola]|uniref:RND efflux system, inner membrane transporter n=1 Tax=Frigoriglobus tundricola TaxID=2774151 RepID=A0A6M5YIQ3_9BACT|nr:efflux RND transporter permease subunit [Frigoriglobus tundricola]QJW93949.1 RND efflux system, inner membrane transporter [Frigoriglobus tundricola]
MFARVFIDRPVLAWVISVVFVLLGAVAAGFLPVAEYPEIQPPTVRVTASYPGAGARIVADTVAAPIEQQVVGVEGMMYMSSQSNTDGSYTLDVTFEMGTDVNLAQVLVQNRVAIAQPTLPPVVQAIGVAVKKRSPDVLLGINLTSDDDPATGRPSYDSLYMSNYATIHLRDVVARAPGVGDVTILGQRDYSMRVWLDPDKLQSRDLTVTDVLRVLREQNVHVAAGQLGQPPIGAGQDFQYTLTALGRLTETEQFAQIVLKTGPSGEITYLRDVARVELGARNQDTVGRLDGKPSPAMIVFLLPGANALDTADGIKAKLRELEPRLPKGLHYAVIYDTTPFIRESVAEVFHTLRDAIVLVAIVILLFLQDWKALLLPVIDVTVSLVGTFVVMGLMGFTLNNLTLFGLVLAIGIVVDDAIVVLENIERWLEKGLPVREATIRAMQEITGPIVAITLVLSSVLLPSAFLGGITGQFFRQFALVISVTMLISAINAMTLTPARAAWIFGGRKPGAHGDQEKEALPWWSFALLGGFVTVWLVEPVLGPKLGLPAGGPTGDAPVGLAGAAREWGASLACFLPGAVAGGVVGRLVIRPVNAVLGRGFRAFNRAFEWANQVYGTGVGWCLRLSAIVLLVYVGLLALTGVGFARAPGGFIPVQDRGYLVVNVQLPDAASLERTVEATASVEKVCLETPGVAHTFAVPGTSLILNANGPNYANMFVILEPFAARRDEARSAEAIIGRLRARLRQEVPEARVLVFAPPAVRGLGNAGGFKLMVEATGDVDYEALQARADGLAARANREPDLVGVFNGFRARTPQLHMDIDREKAKAMGVTLSDVFDTLQGYLGSYYVNDFNRFGRTWQVNIQADMPFRADADAVRQLKVRNADGDMVPLGAVAVFRDAVGPTTVTRYNTFTAAPVTGSWQPGASTSDVLRKMDGLAAEELPASMFAEWTEVNYLQKQAARADRFRDLRQNPLSAFVLGAVLVFFVLAGLYESWSLPLAVVLVVPMCVLSALAGVFLAHLAVDIFVQVAFVVLVGLACKNAILIVEFARDREHEGATRFDAAVEAAKVRLRPILMTSFAFVLGVFPLVIAHGAGAEMRRTLGTAVFAGMLGVTFFGLVLTPVFYSVVRRLAERGASPGGQT